MPGSNTKYIVSLIVLTIVLIGAVVFGGWAFSSRQDFKNNSDKKAATAVAAAVATAQANQKAKDDEASKQPFKTYNGSLTYGGVTFNYPRTWSGLVDTTAQNEPINGYFYPDLLPGLDSKTPLALRVELLTDDYATTVSQFDQSISDGSLKATAYIPPKMANVANVQAGLRLDGQITTDFQGSMVVIKVRDKTLEISTQSKDYLNDFNNTVLSSLTFVP